MVRRDRPVSAPPCGRDRGERPKAHKGRSNFVKVKWPERGNYGERYGMWMCDVQKEGLLIVMRKAIVFVDGLPDSDNDPIRDGYDHINFRDDVREDERQNALRQAAQHEGPQQEPISDAQHQEPIGEPVPIGNAQQQQQPRLSKRWRKLKAQEAVKLEIEEA